MKLQIGRYEALTGIPAYTGFTAGDIIDVFIETDDVVTPANPLSFSTTGITVELNGSPLAYTTDSLVGAGGFYLTSDFNLQFCSSTSLVICSLGWPIWPYATYYSLEDHPSCAVSPGTCNLIIIGTPSVVPASSETTADGSITVLALSLIHI